MIMVKQLKTFSIIKCIGFKVIGDRIRVDLTAKRSIWHLLCDLVSASDYFESQPWPEGFTGKNLDEKMCEAAT
jgi:hypothetical protein